MLTATQSTTLRELLSQIPNDIPCAVVSAELQGVRDADATARLTTELTNNITQYPDEYSVYLETRSRYPTASRRVFRDAYNAAIKAAAAAKSRSAGEKRTQSVAVREALLAASPDPKTTAKKRTKKRTKSYKP